MEDPPDLKCRCTPDLMPKATFRNGFRRPGLMDERPARLCCARAVC